MLIPFLLASSIRFISSLETTLPPQLMTIIDHVFNYSVSLNGFEVMELI